MKLLVDLHSFDNHNKEGVTTYLEGLYSALIPISAHIEFYMVAVDIDNLRAIFGEHKNVHYVSLRSRSALRRLLFEIPSIIRRYGIDYAHYQYISPLVRSCKSIVTLHDILFVDFPEYFPLRYRAVKGYLFERSARRADLLLTVSEYSRERISHHYHIDKSQIHITPNAVGDSFRHVDIQAAQEFVAAQRVGRYILYVSRFEPRKNHVALLRAYCELRLWERGYDLVMIGQRSLRVEAFDDYMDGLSGDIKCHIHLLSGVSQVELQYWYRRASLFVYPSLCEGFGIPPLEAVASGVPTVCSGATAMSEFSFLGEDLIDVEDAQSLNRAILRNLDSGVTPPSSVVSIIKNRYNWLSSARVFKSIIEG